MKAILMFKSISMPCGTCERNVVAKEDDFQNLLCAKCGNILMLREDRSDDE